MGICHSTAIKNNQDMSVAGSPAPTLEDLWSDGEAFATLQTPKEKKRQTLKDKIAHALKDVKHISQDAIRKLRREIGDGHYHAETCIPGIYSEDGLHDIVTNLFHSKVLDEAEILVKTGKANDAFKDAQGKPRTVEHYRPVWKAVRKAIGDNSVQFPETLDADTLQRLVAHNPFVTMGLSFENGQICWNASKRSKNPITAAVMGALSYQPAVMYFSQDLRPTHLVLDGEFGKYTPDHPEFDTKLRAFITPLLYFFEVVHATLHVWTYVMLNAAEYATWQTDMAGFVHQYEPNIFLKYQEVALLLFKKKGGVLTGHMWKNVDYDNCMAAAKKIFEHMSAQRNSRDWYENVFCAGCPQLIDNDAALPLAKPYVRMFESLSAQTMKRLRTEVEDQYFVRLQDINDRLVENLNLVDGKEDDETFFGLKNFSQWIECQGMAGVLHGSTLGLTRLIFTPYNVLDGKWESKTIDDNFLSAGVAVGTLLGLEEEHAVNEKAPLKCTAFFNMMGEFESATHKLQKEFWENLPEEEKTDYRWIFSVWGPNMLDNTQLTVTTYV